VQLLVSATIAVMARPRGFASDNQAGVLPEALKAIADANAGHAAAYGADPWTERLRERIREQYGPQAQGFPVFNGTGANVTALRAMLRPWEGVICASSAHLNVDEGGAPEAMGGFKLLTVDTADGKLRPDEVESRLVRLGDEHVVAPRVVSITQSTELGTLYSPAELSALTGLAHERGLLVHVDGARVANAAAALGGTLADAIGDADVLSFGGTKAGLMLGEAIVVLTDDPGLTASLPFLRKQSMQLASKMRFVSAQLDALLTDDAWLPPAGHANAMAARLADAVTAVDGVTLTQRVEANAVFAILPTHATERLQRDWPFYVWDERTGEVRWMCSWDTTESDVDEFAADVGAAVLDRPRNPAPTP